MQEGGIKNTETGDNIQAWGQDKRVKPPNDTRTRHMA
jgi:hypothetical protein